MQDWTDKLFATIDRKDSDGFVSFLTDHACFRFGNAPVICNKKDILRMESDLIADYRIYMDISPHPPFGLFYENSCS